MRPRTRPESTPDSALIDSLGGTSKLAEALGYHDKGGPQRVSNWRVRGIPADVKLSRPDLFLRDLQIAPKGAPVIDGPVMRAEIPRQAAPADGSTLEEKFNAYRRDRQPLVGEMAAEKHRGMEIEDWLSLKSEVDAHLHRMETERAKSLKERLREGGIDPDRLLIERAAELAMLDRTGIRTEPSCPCRAATRRGSRRWQVRLLSSALFGRVSRVLARWTGRLPG